MKIVSQRTQIYLPKDLREEIDRYRYQTGESLAQYLRKAAQDRLRQEKKKKVDLRKLADEVIGSIKPGKGGWGSVKNTYTYIRKMRQEEDEHWMRRWDEAVKSASPKMTSDKEALAVYDVKSQARGKK